MNWTQETWETLSVWPSADRLKQLQVVLGKPGFDVLYVDARSGLSPLWAIAALGTEEEISVALELVARGGRLDNWPGLSGLLEKLHRCVGPADRSALLDELKAVGPALAAREAAEQAVARQLKA